jgi:TIR domain
MPHDAFISYSSRDKATADAACAALEASGIRCWIAPRDITPGAEWGEAIIDAINGSRAFLLIFSANANDSPQIRREVERAVAKGIPIIPLRIEEIAPTRSLEYFIGTVHWLDALTPPLEGHLRRLVDAVSALLQIERRPPLFTPGQAPAGAGAKSISRPPLAAIAALAVVVVGVAAAAIWWALAARPPQPQIAPASSTATPASPAKTGIDPIMLGTFASDAVIDDYDWHFVLSIAADGSYRLLSTQQEDGTFQAANGAYRTVGTNSGRVRTGTYRAVSGAAIALTSAAGTSIFHPLIPAAPLDQANPVMLGPWQATAVEGGLTWTLTLRNNANGTYHYEGRAEDHGTSVIADGRWSITSAVTGGTNTGTYRAVDARALEITGLAGPALWRRQ